MTLSGVPTDYRVKNIELHRSCMYYTWRHTSNQMHSMHRFRTMTYTCKHFMLLDSNQAPYFTYHYLQP